MGFNVFKLMFYDNKFNFEINFDVYSIDNHRLLGINLIIGPIHSQ